MLVCNRADMVMLEGLCGLFFISLIGESKCFKAHWKVKHASFLPLPLIMLFSEVILTENL